MKYNRKETLLLVGTCRLERFAFSLTLGSDKHQLGKRIGFFIDGSLKSSPEILEPLDLSYIILPIRTTIYEAEQIAQGIMAEAQQAEPCH